MAHIYIRSGATGANNGTSWTNAYTSLITALQSASEGSRSFDIFVVADDHSEVVGSNSYLAGRGDGATTAVTLIYCANTHTVMPPTGTANTASITVNGLFEFRGALYVEGINFTATSFFAQFRSSTSGGLNYNNSLYLRNCSLTANGSATSYGIDYSYGNANTPAMLCFDNTFVRFNHPDQGIFLRSTHFRWVNTDNAVQNLGGGVPAILFRAASLYSKIYLEGVDLSGLGANVLMQYVGFDRYVDMRECKLSAATTLRSANITQPAQEFHLFNSDSSSSGFRNELNRHGGVRSSETTVRRLAPRRATTGATDYSDRITTDSNVSFEFPFYTEDYVIHNTAIQSPIAVSMYTLTDNVTLTNQDFWFEVEYTGTANSQLTSFVSSRRAVIGTAASYPTDTVSTWNTTGITTPVKQTVSVTIEPKIEGSIRIRVFVARPSTTIYLHPRPTIV